MSPPNALKNSMGSTSPADVAQELVGHAWNTSLACIRGRLLRWARGRQAVHMQEGA